MSHFKWSVAVISVLLAISVVAQNARSENVSMQSPELILAGANKPIISQNYFCDKADLATYATMTDCLPALDSFPISTEHQTFTSQDFPKRFTNGKCEVLFEIEPGQIDQGSLLELYLAATRLATTCQRFREPGDRVWFELRTNGVVRGLGRQGKISVRVGKANKLPVWPNLGQADNTTISDLDQVLSS